MDRHRLAVLPLQDHEVGVGDAAHFIELEPPARQQQGRTVGDVDRM